LIIDLGVAAVLLALLSFLFDGEGGMTAGSIGTGAPVVLGVGKFGGGFGLDFDCFRGCGGWAL
jgi:hypothetical protein